MADINNTINVPQPGSPRFESDTAKAIGRIRASLGGEGRPYFQTLTLGGLTATRLVYGDSNKTIQSVADLTSWVAGTADEVTVADDGDGTITIGLADPLIVGKGGTGAATLTDHSILLGSGTDAITPLGAATDGQLPIGSTGADPVLTTLTGTADAISVTNGAGSITLNLDGSIGDIAALTPTDGNFIVGDGANWVAESGNTARTSLGLGTGDSPTFANVVLADGGALKVSDGSPQIVLDNTNGYVEITGATGINTTTPKTLNSVTFSSVQFQAYSPAASIYITANTDLSNGYAGLLLNRGASDADARMWAMDVQPYDSNTSSRFAISTYTDAGSPTRRFNILRDGKIGIGSHVPLSLLDVDGDSRFGDSTTNYVAISATGDLTFAGSAGFYPRVLNQAAEPAAGTGATQCDAGEAVIWTDTDDSKCYLCYNHGGTVKTVELT